MGIDIELNLEYHTTPPRHLRRDQQRLPRPLYAIPVIANRYSMPRDKDLFNALAGVYSSDSRVPLIPSRGLPDDVCREIFHRYYVEILPIDSPVDRLQSTWKWCFQEDAEKWLQRQETVLEQRGTRQFVVSPFCFSPSYLYLNEIARVLQEWGLKQEKLPVQFVLVLEIMKSLDKSYGDRSSRIVFWFSR